MEIKRKVISGLLALTYFVIGYFIPFIAFGQYQCRIQDSLYALIPLFGFSGVVGTFLGHLIYNIYGFSIGIALGWPDLLSPFLFLIPKILLWKFGLKALPIHFLFVALWVGVLLQIQFGVSLLIGSINVGIGEAIALGIGVPLNYTFRRIINKE